MIESERMSDSRLYLLGSSVVYYRRTFLPHRDCVTMRRDSMYLCMYRYIYSTYTYILRIVRAEYKYRMRCMNHSCTQLSKSFQVITLSDFKLNPTLIRKLYCNIATVIYILACWPCSRYCTCSPSHATRPFQGTDDQRSRSSLWSMRIRTGTRMGA